MYTNAQAGSVQLLSWLHTALELAVYSNNVQCAKVLISAGADVNHVDSMCMTSLHMAI
jgi:ankyrin repeat protein